MRPELVSAIDAALAAASGEHLQVRSIDPAGGGCIHRSFVITGTRGRCFVKTNERRFLDAFEAEADGLAALAQAGVRAPAPLCHGEAGSEAFLVLEYLELRSGGDAESLGRALALLHSSQGKSHGWHRDNFIGATPQRNRQHDDWAEFFRDERLRPQLRLALENGHASLETIGERLCDKVASLLKGHHPAPSLLHGDLWGGNAGFIAGGAPVLFDPAAYYGDAEADLAMTELFGGFAPKFYAAYRELRPPIPGYELRRDLYNLYHVLNHANLFGGGYVGQARRLMDRLAA